MQEQSSRQRRPCSAQCEGLSVASIAGAVDEQPLLPVTDLVLRPHYLYADADAPLGYALSYLEPKPVSSSSRSSTKSKQKRKGGTAPIGSSSGAAARAPLSTALNERAAAQGSGRGWPPTPRCSAAAAELARQCPLALWTLQRTGLLLKTRCC